MIAHVALVAGSAVFAALVIAVLLHDHDRRQEMRDRLKDILQTVWNFLIS